jgi:fatty-acyl-CoA synthase
MFIGDWLDRRAKLTPHKVALIDTLHGNQAITFQAWNRNANQTANFLREQLGIQKGDRVAVLAMNSVEYLDIWFALGKLGAILQNLNWRLSPRELSDLLIDAAPKVLIYGDDFLALINAMRGNLPAANYVSLGNKADQADLPFDERRNYGDHPPPEVKLCWSDPWVICYTGGTTGTPKGALLTHLSITANAVNTVISWGLTANDVTMLNSPLFHTGGLNVFTAPLVYVGGTSIVCKEFDLEQTFNMLTNGDVTIWFGVPTMFVMMQNHAMWDQADFSHLKLLISGGAPCPLPVFEKFWAKGVDFKTGYGLTEAGPNTFWLPPADVRRKPGSVGFPLFHVDVQVVRTDGQACAPGEIGELIIRGPHVCDGYWNNPQATAEAIHPLPCDPQGPSWLHTGDLAQRDSEGYYAIVGRLKDMFISGGENVYPAEVESILHDHKAVAEAAVITIPHETWGEVGCAIVVLKPNQVVEEEALLEFARGQLARYKVPKSVIFVAQLPKTGAGKVDKKRLEETYGS